MAWGNHQRLQRGCKEMLWSDIKATRLQCQTRKGFGFVPLRSPGGPELSVAGEQSQGFKSQGRTATGRGRHARSTHSPFPPRCATSPFGRADEWRPGATLSRQTLETRKNFRLPSPLKPAAPLVPRIVQLPSPLASSHLKSGVKLLSHCPGAKEQGMHQRQAYPGPVDMILAQACLPASMHK
jgi:hypothetical protein